MRHFKEDIKYFKTISKAIEANNSLIVLNWIDGTLGRKSRQSVEDESLNWDEVVSLNIEAIVKSDALIIEGSRFNYSQGYQTAFALQHGKPVLNLYRDDLPEYKEWPDKFFVSGISSPLFVCKSYRTTDDITKIVTEFIESITPKTKELELKLALPIDAHSRLEQLSQDSGRSKASLIKELLEQSLTKKAE